MEVCFPFCNYCFINENILEITPHHGIEISGADMMHLQLKIFECKQNVGLIINRTHQFSYSFAAMAILNNLQGVIAIADVNENAGPNLNHIISAMFGTSEFKITSFADKHNALDWLKDQCKAK